MNRDRRFKHSVSTTVTEDDYARLHLDAAKAGMSASEYIRQKLFAEKTPLDCADQPQQQKKKRAKKLPLAYWVYVIKCSADGSVYFGRTSNWQSRWVSHLSCVADTRNGHPLYVAMRLHGVDKFEMSILHVTMDYEESKMLEGNYINKAREKGMHCYNVGCAANGHVVRQMVDAAKRKWAEKLRQEG